MRTNVDEERLALLLDSAFGALSRLLQRQFEAEDQPLADIDLAVVEDDRIARLSDQPVDVLRYGLASPREPQ